MTIENAAPVVAPVAAPVAAPAAPVVAPAAAPAAPVTTQVSAAPAAAATATFGAPVTYEKIGSPGIDMAMEYLGGHGLAVDHPAMVAAGDGDFSQLKALLAGKAVPGWEQYVALAEEYVGKQAEATKAAEETTAAVCVAAAGDAKVWEDVMTWAGANADEAELPLINEALKKGGVMAEAMAHFLVNGYKQSPGTTYTGKQAVNPLTAGGSAAQPTSGPLDPRAYGLEVAKLHAKMGGRMDGSKELEALNLRRSQYRG